MDTHALVWAVDDSNKLSRSAEPDVAEA